jgi:hypothetical protein
VAVGDSSVVDNCPADIGPEEALFRSNPGQTCCDGSIDCSKEEQRSASMRCNRCNCGEGCIVAVEDLTGIYSVVDVSSGCAPVCRVHNCSCASSQTMMGARGATVRCFRGLRS